MASFTVSNTRFDGFPNLAKVKEKFIASQAKVFSLPKMEAPTRPVLTLPSIAQVPVAPAQSDVNTASAPVTTATVSAKVPPVATLVQAPSEQASPAPQPMVIETPESVRTEISRVTTAGMLEGKLPLIMISGTVLFIVYKLFLEKKAGGKR